MAEAGDIFCVRVPQEEVWIALQVWKPFGIPKRSQDETSIDKLNRKSTGVMLLDWHSPDLPAQEDIVAMQPFRRSDSRFMNGQPIRGYISGDIPPYCVHAGHREILPSPYGGGYTTLWNLLSTYVHALHPFRMPSEIWAVLREQKQPPETLIPLPDGSVISAADSAKYDTPSGILDLRHTYYREPHVCIDSLDKLLLPPTVLKLWLSGKPKDGFTVDAFARGRRIQMRTLERAMYLPGLEQLHAYEAVTAMDEAIDMAQLAACYPHLYSLRMWGEFGTVKNMSAARQLRRLRQLQVTGYYGFVGEEFPAPEDLPELGMLVCTDIPKEALDCIRRQYKGHKAIDMSFGSGRTEAWLKENRDNPLRCWQGREGFPLAKAKRAAGLYKQLRADAQAAENTAARTALFEQAAKDFYALDKRGEFLETVELEELHGAIAALLEELAIPAAESTALLGFFDGMMP